MKKFKGYNMKIKNGNNKVILKNISGVNVKVTDTEVTIETENLRDNMKVFTPSYIADPNIMMPTPEQVQQTFDHLQMHKDIGDLKPEPKKEKKGK